MHPKYRVQDWDDAHGAIQWPRLVTFLQYVKGTGAIPESHMSHDHLNAQREVPLSEETIILWREKSERIAREHLEKHGERVVWAIVDGFLLYWSQVRSLLV